MTHEFSTVWEMRNGHLWYQNPSACNQDFDVETHSVKLYDACNSRGKVDKIESSKGHTTVNVTLLWELGVGQKLKNVRHILTSNLSEILIWWISV